MNTGNLPTDSFGVRALSPQLGTLFASRFVISTSRRMIYTFAAAFSRGLGIPLTSITSLIALNQATGLLGPAFGILGDRWGHRVMMLSGVGVLSIGLWLGGLFPAYVTLLLAVTLAGLSKVLFDPMAQAYVGERVPYERRGLVIGLLEISWAASTLVGIPLVGFLIARTGWRSPLIALGGLGLLCFAAVLTFIPRDARSQARKSRAITLGQAWRQITVNPAVGGALGFTLCLCAANDILFVVYGAWLESAFGLSVTSLGMSMMVIGIAEVTGEVLTAFLSDRVGLGRALLVGMSLSVLSYFGLPFMARTLPSALAGILLVFLTFEFTIVTSFAYFSEIVPGARGTMMSFNLAAGSLGRVAGALLGGGIWVAGGIMATSLSAGIVSGLGWACLVMVLARRRVDRPVL